MYTDDTTKHCVGPTDSCGHISFCVSPIKFVTPISALTLTVSHVDSVFGRVIRYCDDDDDDDVDDDDVSHVRCHLCNVAMRSVELSCMD